MSACDLKEGGCVLPSATQKSHGVESCMRKKDVKPVRKARASKPVDGDKS